jgi:HK97 family phage prohead protease
VNDLEYRHIPQASIGAVDFPKRTIELIVMPYEQEAVVEHRGRAIREIVSRGAFDGIDQRPDRVKVNRDHNTLFTCGKAVAFHPSRTEGLVAEVYISKTDLGNDTLELANDGMLDASAGFRPKHNEPNAEEWPSRDFRRLNKIWLGHIAMTPEPAYEGARVLAVRSDASGEAPTVAKPNMAEWLALVRQDEYDLLSR